MTTVSKTCNARTPPLLKPAHGQARLKFVTKAKSLGAVKAPCCLATALTPGRAGEVVYGGPNPCLYRTTKRIKYLFHAIKGK